jgi:hypothetical protein
MPHARRAGASGARLATSAAIVAAALALAGCAASSGTPATSQPASIGPAASGQVIAPVIVDLNDVDGTRVEVAVGNTIDLTGDDETYAEWMAEIGDESIVEFIAGRDDGSAQFNPGLDALAPGETDVTLDNAETGKTMTFTVEVTDD